MSKHPFLKLQSSLSLEDLLEQPSHFNAKNWLLTYLDVFVLITMMVITLITLRDINTEQQAANEPVIKPKAPSFTCPPTVAPVIADCPPPVVVENRPLQQPAITEQPSEMKLDSPTETKQSDTNRASINTPEIKIAAEAINSIPAPTDTKPVDTNLAAENNLQTQLTKTIDDFGLNKSVNVKVTHGYAQLEIQDKVLFKSSEADLTDSGEALLKSLTPLLKQAVGLILIEGHTDNIPIKTARFPSNWELGSSRATSVLHFLISQQLDTSRLRAITYADTMPVADNSTPEGREKNRRVNLMIKFSDQSN
jgi:chemotaxis protein MotB